MNRLKIARSQWQKADSARWVVASIAYRVSGRHGQVARLADAIGQSTDTVQRLARAYMLFVEMAKDEYGRNKTTAPVRYLRRKYHYTRWDIVCEAWNRHEFDIDEAREYLEDFEGGNDALFSEIENKHGAPEWERRAYGIYKDAFKLSDDITAPMEIVAAAKVYCAEYNKWAKAAQ